ncbi:hypothetical protein D9758_006019 [Tetrapyrgos nigripes]|uniref:Uncharacterized protein n=1 Tax=Tetrapyrgos nigripes TaxID=182062 RepID=A0A8H5D829_9AGAR|nr:hypothetical protein D9758_006019 [Tetrapyrgos nigripes]
MNDSDPKPASLPTLNFGNGLIEIAALTTLIGSSTAGDLILGNRGAAGLVWGSISTFGSSTVIKACAGAACPGWVSHMLGLRTPSSDRAIGMDLSLAPRSNMAMRIRAMMGEIGPLGISCLSDEPGAIKGKSRRIKEHHTYRDIYAFDSVTSTMLSELPSPPPDSPLIIHTYYHYASFPAHHLRFQICVLSLSLLKSLEIYTLVTQSGISLGLLSGAPFLFSLISGVCLEVNDIIHARRPVEADSHFDLVAASPIPATKRFGGSKKVVLGASTNARRGPWWKFFWITTGILQTLTVVLSYFLLSEQKPRVVFIWAGFQLFWVIARISIFNLTEHWNPKANRPMKPNKLESLPLSMRLRVMNLVLGVGSYQAHVHPRKSWAYLDDSFSTRHIAKILMPQNMCEAFPLEPWSSLTTGSSKTLNSSGPSSTSPTSLSSSSGKTLSAPLARVIKVNILAVIGDTALSSATWMFGNMKYGPMDLYDSCIVVFEVTFPTSCSLTTLNFNSPGKSGSRIIAVPCARVFSARSSLLEIMARGGENAPEPTFIPRGTGTAAETEKAWIYWVPCEGGEWLQIKSGPSTSVSSSTTVNSAFTTAFTSTSKPSSISPGSTPNDGNVYSVLGHQVAEVLDDEQLSRILGAGNLNISLKHAEEVKDVVEISRKASENLIAFLR